MARSEVNMKFVILQRSSEQIPQARSGAVEKIDG